MNSATVGRMAWEPTTMIWSAPIHGRLHGGGVRGRFASCRVRACDRPQRLAPFGVAEYPGKRSHLAQVDAAETLLQRNGRRPVSFLTWGNALLRDGTNAQFQRLGPIEAETDRSMTEAIYQGNWNGADTGNRTRVFSLGSALQPIASRLHIGCVAWSGSVFAPDGVARCCA